MYYPTIMHTWMYGNMDLINICQNVKSAGFDGLDLSISDDESYNIHNFERVNISKMAENFGLTLSVASALMKGPTHDLSHNDLGLRKQAIDFVKRAIDASGYAGVRYLLVMPSRIYNTVYYTSREDDWKRSVESLFICAEYAAAFGITLLLEPLNRQKVTLVRTLEEGKRIIQDVGRDNIYLVPDIYQMSMEEICGIPAAIREYGQWIQNIHVADSTRCVPGMGVYNWHEILTALNDINYKGALSFEPVFLDFDAVRVFTEKDYEMKFSTQLKLGVNFIHTVMQSMTFEKVFNGKCCLEGEQT